MMANYSHFNSEPRHRAQDPFRQPDNQGFEFPSMVANMPGSPVHPIFSRPGQRGGSGRANEGCSLAVDVRDCGDHLVFHVEAPGCKVDDLHVNLKQGNLVISGSKEKCTEGNSKYLQEECSQGSFSRTFRVPDQTRPEDITATFHHGVLDVMVKRPQNLSSPIKVNTAPRNTQDNRTSDQGNNKNAHARPSQASPIKVNTSGSAFTASQKAEDQNKSRDDKDQAHKDQACKNDTCDRNQERRSGDNDSAAKKDSNNITKENPTGITLDADEFTCRPRNIEHRPSGDDDEKDKDKNRAEDNKQSDQSRDHTHHKKDQDDVASHSTRHNNQSSPIRVRADSNGSDDGKPQDVKVDLGNTSTTQPINLEIHLQIGQDGSVSQVQKNQGHQGHHTTAKKDDSARHSSPIKITTSGSKHSATEMSRDNRDPNKAVKPSNTKSSSPITVGNTM